MEWCFLFLNIIILFPYSDGAACSADTYGTDPLNNANIRVLEEDQLESGVLVSLDDYVITCDCGVLTEWSFYAKRGGIIHFFVSRSAAIIGSTSVYVPPISTVDTSSDNYFHIALSSEMWISVQNEDKLGFFTEDTPMITYEEVDGASATRDTGLGGLPGSVSGSAVLNKTYAVMAKVEAAKAPFFLNLPFTTTLYTHNTGTVIHTYSVTDLDPQDVDSLSVTMTADIAFVLDTAAQTVTYQTKRYVAGNPYTLNLTVTDACGYSDKQMITVNLIDEPLYFTNLPAGGPNFTIDESGATGSGLPFTIEVTDPSGDAIRCNIDSVNPASGAALFTISGLEVSYVGGPIPYATSPYYDLLISCTNDSNTIYSNIVVDIVKNEPPVINNLPASVLSVDINNVPVPLFTVNASDPEGDILSYTLNCTSNSSADCSSEFDASWGDITYTGSGLSDAGYDIVITVSDGNGNEDKDRLTITVTGFTSTPVFTNLPATRNIVEGTAGGTYLYTVNYKDENIFNTFTLSKSAVSDPMVDTYIDFDVTSGVVTLKDVFDFENLAQTTGLTMNITVTDDSGESDTGTITFNFENKNEGPTIFIGNPTINADEGPKGTVFDDPQINGTDPDAGDNALLTYSLNCGDSSKYFELNDADKKIYFSRVYDLDLGPPSNVQCNVTVSDPKGLQDTGSITLVINPLNDNDPFFPKLYYTFFQLPSDSADQFIADMAADDSDNDGVNDNSGLTYSLRQRAGTPSIPDNHFIIDSVGVLYVKDLSAFDLGDTYEFDVIVTDAGSRSGTAQVYIIFTDEPTAAATTTTERSFTFSEDSANFTWLTLVGVVVLALVIVIVFIIYLDPPVRKAIARQILRMNKLFEPKPVEPKRYPVGKLKVEIGHKVLENNPDSKLPWEFQATNETKEDYTKKAKDKIKPVQELKIISGVPLVRNVEAEVHSSSSGDKGGSDDEGGSESSEDEEKAGPDQWGDLAAGTSKK